MRSSLQSLAASGQPFGTLLVGGAGHGAELPLLRSLGAGRVVLVEPVPASADRLDQLVDPGRNEQVVRAALVSDAAASARLHLVNQPQHSSLREPEALLSLFRGLRSTGTVDVDAEPIAAAIDRLELDPHASHVLVLDVPGMAHALVESLDAARLMRFSKILLRGTDEPLYAGDVDLGATVAMIERAGFAVEDVDQDAVFPFRSVLLARRPGVLEAAERQAAEARTSALAADVARLEAEAARLAAELAARDGAVATATGRIAELEADIEARKERQAHLEKRTVQAEDAHRRLEAQHAETLAARDAQRGTADAREEELTLAWQSASYERDSLGRAMAEAEARIQAAFEALDERTAAAAALEATNAALVADKARLEAAAAAAAEQLAAAIAARDQRLQERENALRRVEVLTERIVGADRATQELARELAESTKERGVAAQAVQSLTARVASLEQSAQALNDELAEAVRARDRFLAERDAARAEAATLAGRLQEETEAAESWKQQVLTLRGRVGELAKSLTDASDAAGLAVRLQTLRENDLAELQGRYATLDGAYQNQNALLEKLATRLVAANEYFQRLAHAAADAGPGALPRLAAKPATRLPATKRAPAKTTAAPATRKTVPAAKKLAPAAKKAASTAKTPAAATVPGARRKGRGK